MTATEIPELLTVSEVANAARVSKMTIYRLVHSGQLPAMRVGRSFRVPETAVKALLEQPADRPASTALAEHIHATIRAQHEKCDPTACALRAMWVEDVQAVLEVRDQVAGEVAW